MVWRINDQNSVPNHNGIEIFHPPPPDNPESESDSDENNSRDDVNVEENEDDSEEDEEHYMVYQEENNDIENYIHLPQIPLINYVSEVEHEEDFGCALLDQLMTSYCMLCQPVKWWRKLFFHMFSLLLNNAYGLHKKFGVKAIAHVVFLEHISNTY